MGIFGWMSDNSARNSRELRYRTSAANNLCSIAEMDYAGVLFNISEPTNFNKETWDIMKPHVEKLCGIKNTEFNNGRIIQAEMDDVEHPDVDMHRSLHLTKEEFVKLYPDLDDPFKRCSNLAKNKANTQTKVEEGKDVKPVNKPADATTKIEEAIKGIITTVIKEVYAGEDTTIKTEVVDKTAPIEVEAVTMGVKKPEAPVDDVEQKPKEEPKKKEEKTDKGSDKETVADKSKTEKADTAEEKKDPVSDADKNAGKPDEGEPVKGESKEEPEKKGSDETTNNVPPINLEPVTVKDDKSATPETIETTATEIKPEDKQEHDKKEETDNKGSDKGTAKKDPDTKPVDKKKVEDKQEFYVPRNFEYTNKVLAGMPASQFGVFNKCMKKLDRMKKFLERYPNCLFRQAIVRIASDKKKCCVYLFKDATGVIVEVLYNTELDDSKPNLTVNAYPNLNEVYLDIKKREADFAAEKDEAKKKILEKRIYHLDPKLLQQAKPKTSVA